MALPYLELHLINSTRPYTAHFSHIMRTLTFTKMLLEWNNTLGYLSITIPDSNIDMRLNLIKREDAQTLLTMPPTH